MRRLLAACLTVSLVVSNVFFGFPIDLLIGKINESKIVDTLYWSLKDGDVVDRGETDIPTVVRQALAAQSTIDNSVSTTVTHHLSGSPATVFVSQSTGYAFYIDATTASKVAYRKTTDGGATWGNIVAVDGVSTDFGVAVWYDQWTPGDSGTLIHIAWMNTTDEIFYRALDTSNDTFTAAAVAATSNLTVGSFDPGTNMASIAKGTDGALYIAGADATANILARCTTTCTSAANWASDNPGSWTGGNDFTILIPRLSGEMMFIWWDVSVATNDLKYSRRTTSWSAFANIGTALENGIYDAAFGATIDPSNGDVYLAYAGDAATLGTDDDIRVSKFSGSSWSSLTNVVTNSACAGGSACGITGAKIARDNDTGNLYVLYTAQSTGGTSSTGNVYWKYSTDGGSTWSSEFGAVYSSNDNIYGARLSQMPTSNERIYTTWYAATSDDLFGRPIAPKTYEQASYRFFANSDSTDVGSALAAQNTAATLSASGDAFRLRMLVHADVSDVFTDEASFKLQFAEQSGSCDTGFSGETYADVTGATIIAYNNNATPADEDALTANANDPTHSGHTIVNQTYEESNNFSTSQGVTNVGQDGKWDFALLDNEAPAGTSYCLRIVHADGTLLDTYTVVPEVVTASTPSNTLPVASSVSIDSGAVSVTLNEGTTKNVVCAGTVTDTDGFADISTVGAFLYRTTVGTTTASDDNNLYRLYGDSECVPSGGSGNSETYTCTFPVQYFADPTDAGSPNAADTWTCELHPRDAVATGTPAIDTTEMASLLALDVTASISYGTLNANTDSGASNQTTIVTNTGNRDMDPQVSGTDMSDGGSGTIVVGQQKYASGTFTYSSGGTALSTSPTAINLTLPQRTGIAIVADLYWGIGVSNGTPQGSYTGTNTFTAATGL